MINFLNSSQIKFEYTSTLLVVPISISTFIPKSLYSNIQCKLSDVSAYSIYTNYSRSTNDSYHEFSCNFITSSAGIKNISVWYKDSMVEFPISKNNLQVVFAGNSNILI